MLESMFMAGIALLFGALIAFYFVRKEKVQAH